MRKLKLFILFPVMLMAIFSFRNTNAQVKDLGNFLATGAEDAQKLFEPYLAPYINGFGASMTGGWYNTAKVHKLGGFDLTVSFNVGIVPKDKQSFDLSKIIDPNSPLQLNDPNNSITPTIAGAKEPGPQMDYNLSGYNVKAFDMPKGVNNRFVPSPMIQLGVGLIKGTQVMGRYMPTVKMGGSDVGMWGIGGMHSLKQWIPFLKRLPILEVSVMYGFTKLTSNVAMSVTPDDIGAGSLPVSNDYNGNWDNQKMNFVAKSSTANLVISANLPVVCFYGSVGFATTKANLKLNGDYPFVNIGTSGAEVDALVDPINMQIKNQDGGVTKPRFNIGMRIKMAVVTIHFDYTKANYSVATAGLGISFR
jgi:hypothetical protein